MDAAMDADPRASPAGDDVWKVEDAVTIKNACLGLDVTIHPPFIKAINDSRFILLDFYQSRGVYRLLTSRLPPQQGRHYAQLLAKVVKDLRRGRDRAFVASVRTAAPINIRRSKFRGIKPRCRSLKAVAMGKGEVVQVKMNAIDGEFDDNFCLSFSVCFERNNRHTELWVDACTSTWNYLSKLVAHEYRESLEGEDEARAPIDSPNTATAPIATTPAAAAHSSKRQSPGDVKCASPAKRQTTLLSFMK